MATLLDGLEHPWSIAFLPDGRWLITERPGRLRIVESGCLRSKPVAGLLLGIRQQPAAQLKV